MSKIWVIAGNASQADAWIKSDLDRRWDAGEKTISRSSYIQLVSPNHLRGISNPRGVFVGTWRQRKDIQDIVETLMLCSDNNQVLKGIYHELQSLEQQ